jgi:glutathione S-transferase
MPELILTTYDWVPEPPRGYVRDLRIRWALEEANLPYRVESTPFMDRQADHFAKQPFGQIPWLTEGDKTIFETGAILIYLGECSELLLSRDPAKRLVSIEWMFAALNSMEMASVPWSLFKFFGDTGDTWAPKFFDDWVKTRVKHLEPVLAKHEWVADTFSIADIALADVLRLINRFNGLEDQPACQAYVERATSRPAFIKAHADQLAHFAAADAHKR